MVLQVESSKKSKAVNGEVATRVGVSVSPTKCARGTRCLGRLARYCGYRWQSDKLFGVNVKAKK